VGLNILLFLLGLSLLICGIGNPKIGNQLLNCGKEKVSIVYVALRCLKKVCFTKEYCSNRMEKRTRFSSEIINSSWEVTVIGYYCLLMPTGVPTITNYDDYWCGQNVYKAWTTKYDISSQGTAINQAIRFSIDLLLTMISKPIGYLIYIYQTVKISWWRVQTGKWSLKKGSHERY